MAHGYTVLRFTADDIRYHLDDAVLLIKTTLEQLKGRKPKLPAVVMQPFWEWHVCM